MKADVTRQWVNILALLAVIFVNYLATSLPLAGRDTGEISDMFPVLFTPAPYVFAIWGLIYLLLIVFVVYQALPGQRDNPRLRRVGYLFALSCALNIAWLFAWHYLLIGLSLVIMLGLLATLIALYERLEIGRDAVSGIAWVATSLPFSIYLGWITIATAANISITLFDAGWAGWGVSDATWTVVVIAAATAIGLAMLLRRGDVPFNLVVMWALIGIAVARWDLQLIAVSAIAAAMLLGAAVAYRLWSERSTGAKPAPQ